MQEPTELTPTYRAMIKCASRDPDDAVEWATLITPEAMTEHIAECLHAKFPDVRMADGAISIVLAGIKYNIAVGLNRDAYHWRFTFEILKEGQERKCSLRDSENWLGSRGNPHWSVFEQLMEMVRLDSPSSYDALYRSSCLAMLLVRADIHGHLLGILRRVGIATRCPHGCIRMRVPYDPRTACESETFFLYATPAEEPCDDYTTCEWNFAVEDDGNKVVSEWRCKPGDSKFDELFGQGLQRVEPFRRTIVSFLKVHGSLTPTETKQSIRAAGPTPALAEFAAGSPGAVLPRPVPLTAPGRRVSTPRPAPLTIDPDDRGVIRRPSRALPGCVQSTPSQAELECVQSTPSQAELECAQSAPSILQSLAGMFRRN